MTRTSRSIAWSLIPLLALAIGLGSVTPAEAGKYAKKEKVATKDLSPPSEGRAKIVVLRSTQLGAAIYVWTFLDDELFGVTRGKTFVVGEVDPGEYVLWTKAENVSATTLRAEAGETYFVRQVILPGFGKARARVEVVDETEAMRLLKRIKKESRVTSEGREKAAKIAAKHLDLAQRRALED